MAITRISIDLLNDRNASYFIIKYTIYVIVYTKITLEILFNFKNLKIFILFLFIHGTGLTPSLMHTFQHHFTVRNVGLTSFSFNNKRCNC